MRNTLVVLALCVVAIVLGAYFYFYAPDSATGTPTSFENQVASVPSAPDIETDVTFSVLDSGANASDMAERKNYAARDQESFLRVWKLAHGDDKMAVPSIDFSKEYVIGVFAGTKSSGGHVIEVTKVTDAGDTRTVSISQMEPGAGCTVTDALTQPYQLIRVPISMRYLEAVDTVTKIPCAS
ncbi:MAG: protease complex subunit PrcB family protein [Patescibacteria group bacterium]